jgi:hypothetical protein
MIEDEVYNYEIERTKKFIDYINKQQIKEARFLQTWYIRAERIRNFGKKQKDRRKQIMYFERAKTITQRARNLNRDKNIILPRLKNYLKALETRTIISSAYLKQRNYDDPPIKLIEEEKGIKMLHV